MSYGAVCDHETAFVREDGVWEREERDMGSTEFGVLLATASSADPAQGFAEAAAPAVLDSVMQRMLNDGDINADDLPALGLLLGASDHISSISHSGRLAFLWMLDFAVEEDHLRCLQNEPLEYVPVNLQQIAPPVGIRHALHWARTAYYGTVCPSFQEMLQAVCSEASVPVPSAVMQNTDLGTRVGRGPEWPARMYNRWVKGNQARAAVGANREYPQDIPKEAAALVTLAQSHIDAPGTDAFRQWLRTAAPPALTGFPNGRIQYLMELAAALPDDADRTRVAGVLADCMALMSNDGKEAEFWFNLEAVARLATVPLDYQPPGTPRHEARKAFWADIFAQHPTMAETIRGEGAASSGLMWD